jgi:hypothetical protein
MAKRVTYKAAKPMTLSNVRAKQFILAFAAIFFGLRADGAPPEIEGIQLRAACVSDEHSQQIFCRGFVSEIAQSLNTGMIPGARRCIPEDPDQSQLVSVVTKFLDEHSEMLHDPADALVSIALVRAFHCV